MQGVLRPVIRTFLKEQYSKHGRSSSLCQLFVPRLAVRAIDGLRFWRPPLT
jgi:hypothetical protein